MSRWRDLAGTTAAIIGLSVATFSCAERPETPGARPSPAARATPRVDATPALTKWLELQDVRADSAGRRVLYTWTSAAQVEEAARSGTLLLKRDGENGKQSGFAADVAAKTNSPTSTLMTLDVFQRRRFAWPNPWATSLGFEGEHYGDSLIRIVLKKEAAIWLSTPESDTFVDLEQKPLDYQEVLRHVARIAAVYHVGLTDPKRPETVYREFVLVNESQIEEWSVATPAIRERLELDAAMLHLLAREIEDVRIRDAAIWATEVRGGAWLTGARTDDVPRRYEASLAFLSAAYLPEKTAIEAIAKRLDSLPKDGAPIVRSSQAFFPIDALKKPGGEPLPCVRRGSMCTPVAP